MLPHSPPSKRRRTDNADETNDTSSPPPAVVLAHGADISSVKRRAPPKAEKLVEFHKGIMKNTAAKYPGHPLILAGKSVVQVCCMAAAEVDVAASAVICLGYPLKGSKDGLCPLEKLGVVCTKMKSYNEWHVVDEGDHSFKIGKKHLPATGSTQDEAEHLALQAVASFVSRCLGGK